MARKQNRIGVDWQTFDGNNFTWEQVLVEVMMDVRSELERLNKVLQCPNFVAVPAKLDRIEKNTRKRRKPRAVGKPKLRVVARS